MIVFGLSLVAAFGFLIATFLADSALGRSRVLHRVSMVVAAGILLGVALADLIPETFELLDGGWAAFWIACGFLLLFLVEQLTSGHTHHHEPHSHEAIAHGHGHGHAHGHSSAPADGAPCIPTHAVLPFLIGLGLHNFVDGIVIGASHEVSDAAVTGVSVGILVHQLPVGLSFAAVLFSSGMLRGRVNRDAALIAALIPVGALAVLFAPDMASSTLGGLIGMAAGAMLYIATGHLLPEAHSEERRPGVAAAFVIALLGSIFFISALHDHAHGHAHEEHGAEAGHADEHHDEEHEGDDHE